MIEQHLAQEMAVLCEVELHNVSLDEDGSGEQESLRRALIRPQGPRRSFRLLFERRLARSSLARQGLAGF